MWQQDLLHVQLFLSAILQSCIGTLIIKGFGLLMGLAAVRSKISMRIAFVFHQKLPHLANCRIFLALAPFKAWVRCAISETWVAESLP